MKYLFLLMALFPLGSVAGSHSENYNWSFDIVNNSMETCNIKSPIFLCSEPDVTTGKPHVYSVNCDGVVKNMSLQKIEVMDGFSEFRYTVRLEMINTESGRKHHFLMSKAERE